MFTTRGRRGHVGVCLTLIFKVNRQGHVICFGLFKIPDLENVEVDTKIIPCTIITNLVMKGQFEGSSTLNFKVICQGHVINFKMLKMVLFSGKERLLL